MSYKVIHVGCGGGYGGAWSNHYLPHAVKSGRIAIAAIVDRDVPTLRRAQQTLGLTDEQCFTDAEAALAKVPTDVLTLCTPPDAREAIILAALARGLHVLSDKPLAYDLPSACRIESAVRRAGRKMGVTMSHRFDQDKWSFAEAIRTADMGALSYLVFRFTCGYRDVKRFGRPRQLDHEGMIYLEGAIHHLDQMIAMAGAPCEWVFTEGWNEPWSKFAPPAIALSVLRFTNGVRGQYEYSHVNAVGISHWTFEQYRAEFDRGMLRLDHRRIERFDFDPAGKTVNAVEGAGRDVPLLERPTWTHHWLVEQFLDWLDAPGSAPPMACNVHDNLHSMATVAASLESARTGQRVKVQEMLDRARNTND